MLENLQDEVRKADAELETLKDLAIKLGASPTNLHLSNVVRVIEKAVKEKLEAEEKAKAAGYKSVLIALKAAGQKKTYGSVPDELTIAPAQWAVPRTITEIMVGGKSVRRTNPAVSAVQAQTKLKKLLPLIDEWCAAVDEESIEGLNQAFYSESYEDFSAQLMRVVAEERGRDQSASAPASVEEPIGPPIGELILSYEKLCRIWLKDETDFSRLVKEAIRPTNLDWIEKAAMNDQLTDNAKAETASLLVIPAFWEIAEIEFIDVATYERDHPGELPTTGKEFLHRLRKIGLGASIKDYQEALNDGDPQSPSQ